jgi:hypothetical protein
VTIWILAVVILAFLGTVCVWVGLDALNGSLRLLHGESLERAPEKRVAGRVEDTGQFDYTLTSNHLRRVQQRSIDECQQKLAEYYKDGHLTDAAVKHIHRQVRGIH